MRIPTQNYDKEVLPTQADEGIGSRVHTVGSMKENEYQKKQQQKVFFILFFRLTLRQNSN